MIVTIIFILTGVMIIAGLVAFTATLYSFIVYFTKNTQRNTCFFVKYNVAIIILLLLCFAIYKMICFGANSEIEYGMLFGFLFFATTLIFSEICVIIKSKEANFIAVLKAKIKKFVCKMEEKITNWQPPKWAWEIFSAFSFWLVTSLFLRCFNIPQIEQYAKIVTIVQVSTGIALYLFLILSTFAKNATSANGVLQIIFLDGFVFSISAASLFLAISVDNFENSVLLLGRFYAIFILFHICFSAAFARKIPAKYIKKAFALSNLCLGIIVAVSNFLCLILKNYAYGIAENDLSKFTEIGFTPNEIVQILANAVFMPLLIIGIVSQFLAETKIQKDKEI